MHSVFRFGVMPVSPRSSARQVSAHAHKGSGPSIHRSQSRSWGVVFAPLFEQPLTEPPDPHGDHDQAANGKSARPDGEEGQECGEFPQSAVMTFGS